uniref:Ataxin 7 like 2 n=1 Tax=Serinus canaria TaxID=9135 RepID=A0A8C9L3Q5_SERCA
MICLSGLILSGLIVPGAVMPGPPLCGSTGTIRVPATDRILSLAGSGSELEENGKSGSKKLDTMTLIKEDMDIFGHCPAHDEFYLVVCNHCSQVVKPQAFQKHCERRHGPLSKLYARATACHVAVNGQPVPGRTPGAAKALQEKLPGARGRAQPLPEHTDKDNNLCGCSMPSPRVLGGVLGSPPALPSTLCLRVPPGKECDLNRQCGVRNPDTNKLCTRLLTCKIHSVHQRREVQGRAKDFDVLVAELKASTRRGDPPKDRSPPEKEPLHPALQDTPSLLQPPNTPPCRARLSHLTHPCETPEWDRDPQIHQWAVEVGLWGGCSDPGTVPPQFCTFGSRLVTPGCYVFDRRLDRFCAALGSMLEQHLMPAAEGCRWPAGPRCRCPRPPAPAPRPVSPSAGCARPATGCQAACPPAPGS